MRKTLFICIGTTVLQRPKASGLCSSLRGARMAAVAVDHGSQAEIFAQSPALIFGTKQPASLQFWHHHRDKIVAAPGSVAGVMLKPSHAVASNHSCMASAMSDGVPILAEPVMPDRKYISRIDGFSPLAHSTSSALTLRCS